MIGQTISHYKILEKLGEGGMGVVYRAHDTKLDRDVALKFLPHYLTSDPAEKERFYHEARAAASLTHQNIAVVHEIDEQDGQVFIAMEYVEGKTVKQVVQGEPLPIRQVLDIAIQVCEGLVAAHEKGIVHRDIKSDNIIVTSKGQAKITDFGLAKLKGATKLTKAGSTLGTAAYMSPEQAQGEDVDHRSDIFSFGVVLYELLTGKLPFRGEHQAALLYSLVNEEPAPIARFNEKVTPEADRIVAKALEKHREDRYQHVDDLLCDLRREQKKLEHAAAGHVTSVSGGNKSIAVLPFKNLSDSKEDEYFSDGLTEDVITQLSKIRGIEKVIARTPVMRYKQSDKRIRDIAKELDVSTILEGSVRRAGNQVRIVAQLIDANSEGHLWVETYDNEMTQIFAIQSDVAQRIASALNMRLSPGEKEKIDKKQTENTEAYQLCLKGRFYLNKRTRERVNTAIGYFNQAIEKDPNYTLAYTGLGLANAALPEYGGLPPKEYYPRAEAAVKKALELDEDLGEAHALLGALKHLYGWDWISAEKELAKGIELDPNHPMAHHWYSLLLESEGRLDEAMDESKRAQALDPLSLIINMKIGWVFYHMRRYHEAIEEYKKTLELDPNFSVGRWVLSEAYCQIGMFEEAVLEAQKVRSIVGSSPFGLGSLGYAYARSGKTNEARKVLSQLLAYSQEGYVVSFGIAQVYHGLGERSEALDWLERAEEEFDFFITDIKVNPALDDLRGEPRFQAILKKMNLER
jgi:serine/threonine protein kinase/Tfp pilus assembly protein PilF